MRQLNLNTSRSIALDGSGNGTAQLGPSLPGEIWAPAVASFSVSTNTNEAQCKIFIGTQAIPANYVDGSLSGSTGDSTGRVGGRLIYPGTSIFAVWTGGDPGSLATLNVSGMKQVP